MASYARARSAAGRWHVRIEDLDLPRVVPGAADAILRTLECFGMAWDGEVIYQSQNLTAYQEALDTIVTQGLAYPCTCTRREIADSSMSGIEGPIYPGTCRTRRLDQTEAAMRVCTEDRDIEFFDAVQGVVRQNLAREIGDFVLRRADGIFSYQLAVVVDDAALGVTEVVRGKDLLGSTARQVYLQQLLGFPTPDYFHIEIACNARGEKLSKQTLAPAIELDNPVAQLCAAARFLGYRIPASIDYDSVASVWEAILAGTRVR